MSNNPIIIHDISLSFGARVCFQNFSVKIYPGARIALIGHNGTGKSSLLRVLRKDIDPDEGEIILPESMIIGYVPQLIHDHPQLSGGQRFQKELSRALTCDPTLLMLDEPTNHLDRNNRRNLIKMLNNFQGTLLFASHDEELIRECSKEIWHIEEERVHLFSGDYDEYRVRQNHKMQSLRSQLAELKREKKDAHDALMQEQNRASKSKKVGQKKIQNRRWPTVVSKAKANRASEKQQAKNERTYIRNVKQSLIK